MLYPIDQKSVIQTLSDLVRINSINPSLSPEGAGEVEIGTYVADTLSTLGLAVRTYEIQPGRVNVVGLLKGSGKGRALLLNAHMDTVGVDGMTSDPFGAEIRDGRLFGRGAQDMKGSLAAMISAVTALVEVGIELGGDLLVTAVADEEFASIGTEDLVKHVTADAAIVTEPTNLTISRAHRGFIWYRLETFGRAAHGSRYQEGIDANMRMGRFLYHLEKLEQDLRRRLPHPLVGPPSLHAPLLQGGTEPSIYAAHSLVQIERRTIPGETEPQVTAELQAIIDRLAMEDESFRTELKSTFIREPFEIDADALIVKTLEKAYSHRIGHTRTHTGQSFWTDAAILAGAGIETALIGPIGHGLHSEEEWVDIQSVVDLAHILAQTACNYCAVPTAPTSASS
jgi:acetylornithine deacetylase